MNNKQIAADATKYLKERLAEQACMDDAGVGGGKLRAYSGETVENLVRRIWKNLAKNHPGSGAHVEKGDDVPIVVTDDEGNSIEESVDQHCYTTKDKMAVAIEAKTYLDKPYLQRADSDFKIMKEGDTEDFQAVVVSLEDSIKAESYRFFMNRGNVDKVFFLADGKRQSKKDKRIYRHPERLNSKKMEELVEYLASQF